MRRRTAIGTALFCTAAAASAQSGGGQRVVESFSACRAIAVAGDRLACYERAATALESAVAHKDITILDRQDVRATRRSLFGFTLPRIDLFGRDHDDQDEKASKEEERLDTSIAGVRAIGRGRFEIRLPDGATWQNTEPLADPPEVGQALTIRRAALGSYFLKIERGRAVRGMRLR